MHYSSRTPEVKDNKKRSILSPRLDRCSDIKVGKYGRLDHPVAYLKSTALVEQWRMIGGSEQQNMIDRLEEEEEIVRKLHICSYAIS
jgi:hypothetical protein